MADRTRRTVWAATLLYGVLGLLYALLVPPLHAPDEPGHVDLVLHGPVWDGFDAYRGLQYDARIEAALPLAGVEQIDWRVAPRQPWTPLADTEIDPRGQRPTFDQLAEPGVGRAESNPAWGHPPLFYWVLDAGDQALDVVDDDPSWDAAVFRLRLLAVLVGLPTPWLAARVARRLARDRAAVPGMAALACCLSPQVTHSLGSVNNDVLMVPLAGLTLLLGLRVALGDDRLGTAIGLGLAAGLTTLTKVFGFASPVWVAVAYALAWRRGVPLRSAAGRLAVAGVGHVVAGGLVPLRNLLVRGTPVPRNFSYPTPADVEAPLLPWLGEAVERLSLSAWGHFGIVQFPLPLWVVATATVLALGLVVAGITTIARRPDRGPGVAALVVLPVLTTAAVVLYAAWTGYARSGLPTGLQARYLFIGLAGVTAVLAIGLDRLADRRGPVLLLGGVLALQGAGVWTVLSSYWAGGDLLARFATASAWAPIPRPMFALLLLSGAACVVALGVLVAGTNRTADRGAASESGTAPDPVPAQDASRVTSG